MYDYTNNQLISNENLSIHVFIKVGKTVKIYDLKYKNQHIIKLHDLIVL